MPWLSFPLISDRSWGESSSDLEGLGSPALPLLRGLLHGLAERFGVMDDGFELRVRQHPQQVVQNEQQLGGQHVAVLYLDAANGELNLICCKQWTILTRSRFFFLNRLTEKAHAWQKCSLTLRLRAMRMRPWLVMRRNGVLPRSWSSLSMASASMRRLCQFISLNVNTWFEQETLKNIPLWLGTRTKTHRVPDSHSGIGVELLMSHRERKGKRKQLLLSGLRELILKGCSSQYRQ